VHSALCKKHEIGDGVLLEIGVQGERFV